MARFTEEPEIGVTCFRCGHSYDKRKGNFPPLVNPQYRGIGFLPICNKCLEDIYAKTYAQLGNEADAIRHICRMLNIYWSKRIFDAATEMESTKSIMVRYIIKVKSNTSKTYMTTLEEEGTLWSFRNPIRSNDNNITLSEEGEEDAVSVDPEVVQFWGPGYTNKMYQELETRRIYYYDKYPNMDQSNIGFEMLIKQIILLEINIAKVTTDGGSTEKQISTLNNLLGSLDFKPSQKKQDSDDQYGKTPYGVWIRRFEEERPIPEVSKEMKDVDNIRHYITVYFFGHLCRMLNLKNSYSKAYEAEMNKFRVERPELENDDDDEILDSLWEEMDDDEE